MPISKRRDMYKLLVRYKNRDNAIANGQPPPPIDSSDIQESQISDISRDDNPQETIERMVRQLKAKESKKVLPHIKKDTETDDLKVPSVIKDALEKMKQDGLVKESGELILKQSETSKPEAPRKKLKVPVELQNLLAKVEKID